MTCSSLLTGDDKMDEHGLGYSIWCMGLVIILPS